jgi:tetratricopeptide (TPR) repeat protein
MKAWSLRWAPKTFLTLLLVVTVCILPGSASEERFADRQWLDEELVVIDELIDQDRFEEAEVRAVGLLEEVTFVWGPGSRHVAKVLREVIYSRLLQGRPADEEMQRQALRMLEVFESTLGPDALMVAVALTDVGLVYRTAGLFDQAVPMFERAILIRSKRSTDDPHLASLNAHLANALFETGNYDRAGALYQSVLEFHESRSLSDDMTVARALIDVSRVKLKTRDITGARPLVQRALAIFENSSAPADSELASVLTNLAGSVKEADDPDVARALYEYALEIGELILGPEHEEVALITTNLGILDLQTGNLEMARTRLEKALHVFEEGRGPRHHEMAMALSYLGWVAYLERDNDRALELVRRSLLIRETELNPENPDLVSQLYLLGACHEELGQFESAIEVNTRALAINEKAFGSDHVLVAANLVSLGLSFLRADQSDLAAIHLERALSIFGEDGPNGLFVGEAWFGLAVVAGRRGDRVEATRNLEKAGSARAMFPGEGNVTMTFDRARFHALLGEPSDAIRLLREAMADGYTNPRMDRFPDLLSLHGNPEFDALIADSDL